MSPSDAFNDFSNAGIAGELQRGLKNLTRATVGLFVLVLVVAAVGFVSNRITADSVRSETARATGALCAIRTNVNDRIITSQEFLIKHPEGVIGIPAASIQSSITKDKKALKALSNLKCS